MVDFTKILLELEKREIEYIVVGGIAVNLYGIPRMTYDLDLLLNLEDENLLKFLRLISKMGYSPKMPVKIMELANEQKRNKWIKDKNLKAFCLKNENAVIKEIDIVLNSPLNYDEAIKNVNRIELKNTAIPLIEIQDLIKMKENTGRKQDMSDIKYLKEQIDEER